MKRVYFLFITVIISTASFAQIKHTSFKPGQTFTDCKDCPAMIVIPSGSFVMGAKENELNSYPEEKPQREVSLELFACSKFDITKKEWAVFVKETKRPATGGCSWSGLSADTSIKPWDPNPAANWNHIGFMQDSSHPVVCITWYDAQDYVQWVK